jgi:antitoxin component YwqK of YwqJK toxin-antitoxin module
MKTEFLSETLLLKSLAKRARRRGIKVVKNMRVIKYMYICFFVIVFSCNRNEKSNPYQIIANDENKEYFIWFDDSSKDVYNFYKNRKLYYYLKSFNGKTEDEGLYFHENGTLKSKSKFNDGKKSGYHYQFYPSGHLFRSEFYKNDTVYGYGVEYYDKINTIKSEFFYDVSGGYIYKQEYDSLSQKIVHTHDDRKKYLHIYPKTDPKTLRLPREDENWFK